VNPSADGGGRPVQVRVYQLQSDARLRNSSFEEIWQNDTEVLATDLKSMAEYTVFPGKTEVVSLKRDADAHFLSMVALFREPQGRDWFVSYELEQPSTTPPCTETATLPILLDRMQIQDGEGRAESSGADAQPTPQDSTEKGAEPNEGE
jgi:type VI secretion system VasD/TssJ family lipoprotein